MCTSMAPILSTSASVPLASFGCLKFQEHFVRVDAPDDADRVRLQHLPCQDPCKCAGVTGCSTRFLAGHSIGRQHKLFDSP